MSLSPVCEFVDRNARQLHIRVHLRGSDEGPQNRFQLRFRPRWGAPPVVVETVVGVRVDSVGRRSRSALDFTVRSEELAAGAYQLELARVGDRTWIPVGTSPGLLAGARRVPWGERQLQVLPGARRSQVWLRISSWTPPAQLGWRIRDWTRELAFAAHGRRFTWVRPLRVLTRPLVPRGQIWLIGERPETARDNGFALFAHLRRHRPGAPVYYVIAKDSSMAGEVARLGHVVWHSSLRHRILMLHAHVLANAYSIKHMLPSRWRPGAYMNQFAWRVGARRVYLKHGVHLSPDAVKRASSGYDLVVTVGPQETEALAATSGYSSAQLCQTGLARYDNLVRAGHSRTVLFMPTWRRYLVPRLFGGEDAALVPYAGSAYQEFVHGLLDSDDLAAVLERHDLRLAVVPHYNLTGLLRPEHLASERISLLDGASADIPGLLRSCAMLLTDYSSVQFDVAYLGAPVLYAQFDREEYAAGHGGTSWFDTGTDGFGPTETTVAGVVARLEHYAGNGFVREHRYDERVERVFTHEDHSNCARIVQAIDSLP
ncbi:MAG TPA: CDP-glycerol glycerophosphotransferase family protein [Candidatus Ruania gallistercoris]|uniref:CDP-glycerol glycerophosphotransferase family protein n=1 Tax=Candidatus Ruania gallistercoris TaxID=2838746 RepID=A0A9D2EG42_9MICO|nr:CDP-glycerol glycerophosphotransferase family protein [Candidatus Ruania gallistercoris]